MNKFTIIGAGFLGKYLNTQLLDSNLVSRSTTQEFVSSEHDVVVVAAPTGNRIQVNRNHLDDLADCDKILELLSSCRYNRILHISTVDTYSTLTSDSDLPGSIMPIAKYGANRWYFENSISKFPSSQILRLSSLVDKSIQKNILFDLKHNQWLTSINLNSKIQWYPLKRITDDINYMLNNPDIKYLNLVSPPISNRSIIQKFYPNLEQQLELNICPTVEYNVHTNQNCYTVDLDSVWQEFENFFID